MLVQMRSRSEAGIAAPCFRNANSPCCSNSYLGIPRRTYQWNGIGASVNITNHKLQPYVADLDPGSFHGRSPALQLSHRGNTRQGTVLAQSFPITQAKAQRTAHQNDSIPAGCMSRYCQCRSRKGMPVSECRKLLLLLQLAKSSPGLHL